MNYIVNLRISCFLTRILRANLTNIILLRVILRLTLKVKRQPEGRQSKEFTNKCKSLDLKKKEREICMSL